MPYQDLSVGSTASRQQDEPSFFDKVKDFFSGGDDKPSSSSQPVSGGRGRVVERPNERNDYLAKILSDNAVVPPPNVPDIPQSFRDFNEAANNVFTPVYNPQTGQYDLADTPPSQFTNNQNDITAGIVQYIPPNMRDFLMIGGQYDRSLPHALVDNVVGLDDKVVSGGEAFGQQAYDDPLGTLKGMGLGAAEGMYNLLTSPIDTIGGYLGDVKTAVMRDQTGRTADQRLADIVTVASILPTFKVASTGAKALGDTQVAKGLRGELAQDYFGPDGPDIPPSMAGFRVPENSNDAARIKNLYDAHKSLGLTDNQIQERTGIKRYASYDSDGNLVDEVFGETVPVESLDVSNIPYTVKKPEGNLRGVGGYFDPNTKEIVVAPVSAKNAKDLDRTVRHESEHLFQDAAGIISSIFGTGGPRSQFFNQEQILRRNRNAVAQINDEIKAAKKAGNFDTVAQLTQRKNEILADSEAVANVDVYAGYMNSPVEVGARQAEGRPVTTYDPTVTAAELLDKGINPNNIAIRLAESFNRAFLPTHGGLAKFREAGPTVGDTKLLSGIVEALLPLADANTPRVVSTRGNTSYPFLTYERKGGETFQSSPSQRSVADDIQAMIDSLNRKAPVVEFENQKGQMIAGGLSGDSLEFALDNLARRLNIERPDK